MLKSEQVRIQPLGEETLLLQWLEQIDPEILVAITRMLTALQKHPIHGIREYNAAYASIAVLFDPATISFRSLSKELTKLLQRKIKTAPLKEWTIPVCYDSSLGYDLETLCKAKGITAKQLIKLHTAPRYRTHFIGFLPGFMYLGGLDKQLHFPRKSTPDRSIPAGSVAIGGAQTGIYPMASPGGWHVIGNSPVPLFDARHDPPCKISPGDILVFSEISLQQFDALKNQVENQKFTLQPKQING